VALKAVGHERAHVVLGSEREVRLPGGGRVERQRLAERGNDPHRAIGLDDLDRDDEPAPEDGQIRRLTDLPRELGHDGPRLPQEAHVLHVGLAELQAADAEAVVLGRAVLLDVAARLERREEAKDVVLVELQAFREIGDAELFRLAGELLEHVQRVRDGLDDVVRFLSPHHGDALKRRFRLRRVHPVVNGRAEREMARGHG